MSSTPELPEYGSEGDATYLEKTLRHGPTDLLLDDSVSGDEIHAVWRRSIRRTVGTFLVSLVIWVVAGGFGSDLEVDEDQFGVLIAGFVLALIVFCVTWIVFLNSEKQEAISEWCTLLAGQAAAADSVYSHILGRLRERRMPIGSYTARRTATAYGTGNRLVLVDGHHYVYVSVFSYGTSLYLGWSMWRVRKGSVLFGQYHNLSSGNRLDPIERILNLDRLRAMREAVHAVCREALHTAVQEIPVPTRYGFPEGLPPIEGLPYGYAPQPTQSQPAQQ